jgi:hypothetical protein
MINTLLYLFYIEYNHNVKILGLRPARAALALLNQPLRSRPSDGGRLLSVRSNQCERIGQPSSVPSSSLPYGYSLNRRGLCT